MDKFKYPRTLHFPWSGHQSTDDKMWDPVELDKALENKLVVITEKMDGENTTIYPDGTFHARSIDSRMHPSRNAMAAIAAEIGYQLPAGWRMCGENLYAKHSIGYNRLPSYFLAFGIYDENNTCLAWDDFVSICKDLGINHVPLISTLPFKAKVISKLHEKFLVDGELKMPSAYGDTAEGYVVRLAEAFSWDSYGVSTGKYVRPKHVQTDEHWMHSAIVPNGVSRFKHEIPDR